ncbi:MAG TPA: TonB family protein [Vicinamibacterales bacterium]|nr:TonB family protein [Vicinamibacterales bacterium]
MYLDLEDYRPDTPRVPQAISLREGVLVSLLIHALMVIAYLVAPEYLPADPVVVPPASPHESVQYVQITPRFERNAPPRAQPEQSDRDRRAASPETPPTATNTKPFSVGDTSERVVASRDEKPKGPENGTAQPNPSTAATPADLGLKPAPPSPAAQAPPAGGGLANALKNLGQYLQDGNFDNQQGGQAERLPDIQFDSKGVDFGPWLRRFVQTVKRNWNVPAAMFQSGRVVIQFYVLRNGTITDLKIVSRSPFPSYDNAAFNALKNSSPVLPLPAEYPDDRAFFTVTFYYDVRAPLGAPGDSDIGPARPGRP